VILFSSVAAQQGFGLHSSIGMAKGAVNGLTLSLAVFLLSQEADWITGQIIGVDGGRATLRTKH
jgi:NAD(P)-dependent dehydrogenase (short-subunit alcohol dehydrogenase family)